MCMDLYNVQKLLQAKILTGSELMHRQIESCSGSDMLIDVLPLPNATPCCARD